MNAIAMVAGALLRYVLTVLLVLMVILKLTGVISWGWVAVLWPLWAGFALGFLAMLLILVCFIYIQIKS